MKGATACADLQPKPADSLPQVADVVVIGAGIVGAACAYSLAADGHRVVIVERGSPVSETSAHGEGNVLVSDKTPGPSLDLSLCSAHRWAELVIELDDLLGQAALNFEYEPKGGLTVAMTDVGADGLATLVGQQRARGIQVELCGSDRAKDLEPHLTSEISLAAHCPSDAQVQPVIAAHALLAAARRYGATIVPYAEVTGMTRRRGNVRVLHTTQGRISSRWVVVASGPWAGATAHALGLEPVPVEPRKGLVLVTASMPRWIRHKVYDADYIAAADSESHELVISGVLESTPGGPLLIGSSRERTGFDRSLSPAVLAQLAQRALVLFPGLAAVPVVRAYGGFRPYSPDHLPLVGQTVDDPAVFLATGHEGSGIGWSPTTGDLIAAAISGTTPPIDPVPFAPARFTSRAQS